MALGLTPIAEEPWLIRTKELENVHHIARRVRACCKAMTARSYIVVGNTDQSSSVRSITSMSSVDAEDSSLRRFDRASSMLAWMAARRNWSSSSLLLPDGRTALPPVLGVGLGVGGT
jgi:hypothetical protein